MINLSTLIIILLTNKLYNQHFLQLVVLEEKENIHMNKAEWNLLSRKKDVAVHYDLNNFI